MLRKIYSSLLLSALSLLIINQAYGLDIERLQKATAFDKNGSDLAVTGTDLDPRMFVDLDTHKKLAGQVMEIHETSAPWALRHDAFVRSGKWWQAGKVIDWAKKDYNSGIRVQHVAIGMNNQGCILEANSRSEQRRALMLSHPANDENWNGSWKDRLTKKGHVVVSKTGVTHGGYDGSVASFNEAGVGVIMHTKSNGAWYSVAKFEPDCSNMEEAGRLKNTFWQENGTYDVQFLKNTHSYSYANIAGDIALGSDKWLMPKVTPFVEVHRVYARDGNHSMDKVYYNTGIIAPDSNKKLNIKWADPVALVNQMGGLTDKNSITANGQWPRVALTKDTGNVLIVNIKKYSSANKKVALHLYSGRLTLDPHGKPELTDLEGPISTVDDGLGYSSKAFGLHMGSEGYAFIVQRYDTNGMTTNKIRWQSLLVAQKLIKNSDWHDWSVKVDGLIPYRMYQLGVRPQQSCEDLTIKNEQGQVLLKGIDEALMHHTFYAQADAYGNLELALDPGQCAGTLADSIGTITMNEGPADQIVVSTTTPHFPGFQTAWIQELDDDGLKYKSFVTGLKQNTAYSVGVEVKNTCVNIYDEQGTSIYADPDALREQRYHLSDNFKKSDGFGTMLLTADATNCFGRELHDVIGHVEFYETQRINNELFQFVAGNKEEVS